MKVRVSYAWLAVVLTVACTSYTTPTPEPTEIVPNYLVHLRPERARPLEVTIRGNNLAAGVRVNLKTGEVNFQGQFQALLGDTPLSEVEPVITDRTLVLRAVVPSNLEPGVYDLMVRSPDGKAGSLPAAFEVRTITSLQLQLYSEKIPPVAGDRVTVTATIRDNQGDSAPVDAIGDILFSLDTGSGILGASRLLASSVQIDYDTASQPEGALVRATEQLSGSGVSGTILVDSRAGNVAGVRLEPPSAMVVAGEFIQLTAWPVDARGNLVAAVVPQDILFEVAQGNGSLGQPVVANQRIQVDYTAHTTVETARVRAIENISGQYHTAESEIIGGAGAPAQLLLTASSPAPVAGDPVTLTAELQDKNANLIPLNRTSDVAFTLTSGRGLLSGSAMFGGRCVVIYATYRKIETALIQADLKTFAGIPPAQVAVTSVGGNPVGVTIIPAETKAGAGEQTELSGWLTDIFGNITAASSAGDITFSLLQGPGALEQPMLKSGAVRVGYYTTQNVVGQTAVVEATEHVTGGSLKAQSSILITAGSVNRFEVVAPVEVPAGSPFNLNLTARDQFGNLADSFNGSVFLSDTTGTILPTSSGTFSAGRRTVTTSILVAAPGVVIQADDKQGHTGQATLNVTGAGVDHFEINPIPDQQAGVAFNLTIRAIDRLGNRVDSYAGSVIIKDSTSTVQPGNSGNFSGGERIESVAITRAQPAVVVRVADSLGHIGSSNSFAIRPSSPSAIAFATPVQTVLQNVVSQVIRVQIRDAYQNPSPPGANTNLRIESNAGSGRFDITPLGPFDGTVTAITITAGTTDGDFYYQDSTLGDTMLTVSDPSLSLSPASQMIKVGAAGDPAQVRITSAPTSAAAGVASVAFVVQLQDAGSTPLSATADVVVSLASTHLAQGRFDLDPGGAFDGSTTAVTIPNGLSQAPFYYLDTRAGPVEVGVSSASLVGDTTSLDVLAGPVDHFAFDPIPTQQTGRQFQVRVVALDAYDNLADTFSNMVRLADSTGTISPILSGAFLAGEQIESVIVTGATGANVLSADDGSGHLGQSNPFEVLPGLVDHFNIDPVPSSQEAGVTFSLHLTARDAFGNLATSFIGVVNLQDTTGTVLPVQSGTFGAGQHDQMVAITRAGSNIVISVNDGASHTGSSNPFAVLAGALHHFALGPVPASVGVDRPFDLSLEARDQYQNLVDTFQGTVQIADLTGTLTPPVSGAFFAGKRTQAVTISQNKTDDLISVDDGAGHTGQSNPFDVVEAQPVQLVATMKFIPIAVVEGESFELHLTVTNIGDYLAQLVRPINISFSGTGITTLLQQPVPPWPDVPGRSQVTLVWRFGTGLANAGWFLATAQAEGTDSQTGSPVLSNTATASLPISDASCLLNPLYLDAGAGQIIACGGSAVLGGNPTASGGVPDYTFDWTPTSALNDSSASNPTASPNSNTGYQVTVFDQLGCSAIDSTSVSVANSPVASFTASRQTVCVNIPVWFNASGSSGTAPLVYDWNFGDGGADQGSSVSYAFQNRGWFVVILTVTDANGCQSTSSLPIGVRDGTEPTGPVTFTVDPSSVPANGIDSVTATSDPIHNCSGSVTSSGKRFHVLATRGTILSPDEDGANGIQVRTDSQGRIRVTIRSERVDGPGRLLAMTIRVDRESQGTATFSFTGSSSLPRVIDFAPSGPSSIAPARFAARFDKPMDENSLIAAMFVSGDLSGVISGSVHYDAILQTAVFTPQGLLDPTNEVYTVAVSQSARDQWGNPLDGNLNGTSEVGDDFSWRFGAVGDTAAPSVSCRGESLDPFSPDGDGIDDITQIRADLTDDVGLMLWRIQILSPNGQPLRTLVARQTVNATGANLIWDGHDQSGLLAPNLRYNYQVTAVDAAGNVSLPCSGSVRVSSVLDPAAFP